MTVPSVSAVAPVRRGQFAQPSVAELVADAIRARIVAGTLPDGSMLPKQEQLIDEFKVSRPSFREALRILESEGLISVRRGNVGGAQVHAPTPENAARTLGLVLQARNVALDDLAAALDVIEPACAAHCAQRADRNVVLVPKLRELNVRCAALELQDMAGAAVMLQEFHQAIIDGCGNETLVIVVGALESLWSSHKRAMADEAEDTGSGPEPNLRASVIVAHEEITDAIEAGDAARAHQLVTEHLATVSPMVLDHRAPRIDMTGARALTTFDPAAVRAKYEAERDKRMVEGRAAIHDFHDDAVAKYREDPFTAVTAREPVDEDVEVAIIGAGIAGVVTGAHLRKHGVDSIRLIDQAGGFGGTWYWNRYPGVMCDVESYCYMPMLEEMEYIPTKRYAQGEEIREHVEAIAQRFSLVDAALFHTGVQHTEWDEDRSRWVLRTDRGDEIRAKYAVMAVGILNLMKIPVLPGMETFAGPAFHTARWDYAYTGGSQEDPRMTGLADKVVGIIGTGASAIQTIPPLAESSKHLYVFQRTPAAVGVRGDRPTEAEFAASLHPGWHRERNENFQAVMIGQPVDVDLVDDGWCHHFARINNQPFTPGTTMQDYMLQVDEFDYGVMEQHRRRIRDTITDATRADLLMPYYKYSCRRPLFHDAFLPALNRDNVTIVDCPVGIDRVTEHGVVVDGQEYELDCIVYATGFEPEVTPLPRRAGHEIVGRDGQTIAEKWSQGAATMFGLMTAGFPNLFLMPCPGQQAVVTVNYTLLAEVGAEFVAATITALDAEGVDAFDVTEEAESEWVQRVMADSMAKAPPAGGVPCTPGSRMLFDDDGNMVLLDPHAGTYGGGFGDYFGYRDLLAEWVERGDFAGLSLQRRAAN